MSNPVTTVLDLTVNPNASEAADVPYAIFETSTNQYVQANGTLGASAVFQVLGTASGQWGNGTGISGKVHVTGLSSPVANYIFKVKSRNPNDAAHAVSSESAFSPTAQISNTAPSITLGSIAQTTDGTDYVTIAYTGTDAQSDVNSLTFFQYSTNGTTWNTMTEKTGVGSNGTSNLTFVAAGSPFTFAWNVATDLSGFESDTVKIRLQSSDTLASSAMATSSNFSVDTKAPVISAVSASQNVGAKTVTISYTLTEHNTSTVTLQISNDGGSTWVVPTTSATGDIGAGIISGSKSITWNAGTDFNGQFDTTVRVRLQATDTKGNVSVFASSSNFTVDTHNPVVSNVTATQDSGVDTFTFHYDVSEDLGNATIALVISSNGGSTFVVPITSAAGDVGSVTPGTGKTITWNGATDFANQEKTNMQIRITATDQFTNTSNTTSSNFSLDTFAPRVTSVVASQVLGSTNVTVTYTLADQNNSLVEMDISNDGGTTWVVTNTSVTGDIGSNVTAGSKSITWNAGTDYDEHQQSNMRVRVRAKDIFNNQSANTQSANFALDTLNPATNDAADLQAQPNAGDTTVSIGGSFTEVNPDTNNFFVAIDAATYGSTSAGDSNTATPSNHATPVGSTLNGSDFIAKVKIIHTDDYGQSATNENLSPSASFKFVKPYTPLPPTVGNPTHGTVDVAINKNVAEVDGLEYAIFEITQNAYVQADGTLGASAVWRTTAAWGTVTVNGLSNASFTYQFKVKSRNTSDTAHASSSESALSGGASSANQSPVITLGSIAETTDGTKYVTINYTGTDLESDSSNIITADYSTNGTTWHAMTEKSGVGSDGKTGLAFAYTGTAHHFMWDVGTDLANTEDASVFIRLQANDGTSSGAVATSSQFTIDTKNPVISSVTASQNNGSNMVTIGYTLTDLSVSTVVLEISSDSGSTWTVPTGTATIDVGANVTPGVRLISWNPGTDFGGQENSTMRVRLRATDNFGNAGANVSSTNFAVDTESPRIANVIASQDSGQNTVTIHYDIADTNASTVAIDISEDNGTTWGVATSTLAGDVGAGITSGTGKTVTWNAATDFPNREQSGMMVRVHATDTHNNLSGNVSSAAFAIDTLAPAISNVSAVQTLGTDSVVFTYDLSDSSSATIALDISNNGGSTWTVTDTSLTGAISAGQTTGTVKTIFWNAVADAPNQDRSTMRVRIRGTDPFNNMSANVASSDFLIDTKAPAVLSTADLQAQPHAGDTTATVGGSFIETNPNTNDFLVAIDGGSYGSSSSGDTNTAAPSNHATLVGATLDGNDFISKVKIVHTDDYGHSVINENASPSTALKFVKPYTPQAPSVTNPQNTSVDIAVVPNASETAGLEYAMFETTTSKYVQTNGTLGASAVWRTSVAWGTTTVTGLTSPVAQYHFEEKSRNTSDTLHAASSESDFSATGSIANSAPMISITSASQQSAATYAIIQYIGTDAQNDTNHLTTFEYSTDNATWHSMTEKSGAGSDGTTHLIFASTGTAYTFAWDIAADLPNTGDPTVFVRLQSSDTLASGNLAVSSAFAIDTLGPVVSNIQTSQAAGTDVLTFTYNLSDSTAANNAVTLVISSDGGATFTVPTSTVSGDVGSNVSAGITRTITWNAGTDFNNQENATMQIRVQGTDVYGNAGTAITSANFTVDTKGAVVSNVVALQTDGSDNVQVSYTLADLSSGGLFVEFSVSSDNGSTWTVPANTFTGDVGAGQSTGAKQFVWNAATDFSGEAHANTKVRVRAFDYFGNQGGFTSSSAFALDTKASVVSNVTASQNAGARTVTVGYDLVDDTASNLTVDLEISSDNGSTWTVAHTSTTGAVGSGQTTGTGKIIIWDAGTDFDQQFQNSMMVRMSAKDRFNNQGGFVASSAFTLDTANPVVSNVSASQTSGSDSVSIHYDLADDTSTNLATVLEISSDNGSTWTVSTTGATGAVGSNQTAGTGKTILWNAGADFTDQFTSTMKVRVRATDMFSNQTDFVESSAFAVDTKDPIVSNAVAAQNAGARTVLITYDLADNTSSNVSVALQVSSNNGSTWTVPTGTATGAVGSGQTTGTGKTISWNAGADFNNQFSSSMKVRVRATDAFSNTDGFVASSAFALDTKAPVVSNVIAVQNPGSTNVIVGYDLTDDTSTNLSTVLEVSSDNGSTWTVPATTVSGNIGSGQSTGTGKTVTWAADTDFDNQFQTDMKVRVRATDSFSNLGSNVSSNAFILDTANPVVSNVTASQTLGSDIVTIHYDLADDTSTNLSAVLEISLDNGSTWTVPVSHTSGDVGSGRETGIAKSITWNAGADFNNNVNATMQVRVRATDIFTNQGTFTASSNFSVDTKSPIVAIVADLKAQPNAGDTSVLVGGSFTEDNPNTNDFFAAQNGNGYGSASAGDADTATPSDHVTPVATALKGNNYFSKVKIVHTDDYGHSETNENTSLSVAFKYVKPYTPPPPTVTNPQANSVDVMVNKNLNEVSGLEYAIFESTQSKYVQADGSLGNTAVWQTGSVWETKTVTGLSTPVSTYIFKTKSRNSADALHAASSESALSAGASSATTAPVLTLNSVSQTSGSDYVSIHYTGTDTANENINLTVAEYSLNNEDWFSMTEKTGVGSDGKTNLLFASTGTAHTFVWDASKDAPNTEAFVYVRLLANDGAIDSNLASSSAFALDEKAPVVSNVVASQESGTSFVHITYDVSDFTSSISTFLEISSDNGSTWTVPVTSATGNVGSGQTTGVSKSIVWAADTDFANQFSDTMKVRIRATDRFNNVGVNAESNTFTVITTTPTVSHLTASQTDGSDTVLITYDLSASTPSNLTVDLEVSSNQGTSWVIPTTNATGNVGSGQTTGTGKTIVWNAGLDFGNQFSNAMKVRVRSSDAFSNTSDFLESSLFAVDTKAPVVSNVVALQPNGSTSVTISYDLADDTPSNLTTVLEVSSDNGSTWTVPVAHASGDVGSGRETGIAKFITWNADTDFDGQFNAHMMARVRATDNFANTSSTTPSGTFTLDTANPVVSNVVALQPNGSTSVTISYDLADDTPSNLTTVLEVSSDNGFTWTVPVAHTSGDVWSGRETGIAKFITWNADVDFDGQFNNQMKVRVRAIDAFGNQGDNSESSAFTIDTANPVVSNVVAVQTPGSDTVSIAYDLADDSVTGLTTVLEVSSDNGSTWTVSVAHASGDVGSGRETGIAKSIAWNAGADFSNELNSSMKVRVRATDSFGNQGLFAESSLFAIDTQASGVSNVTAAQTSGSDIVTIGYNLADASVSSVTLEVSGDNGTTWTVPIASATGAVGDGQIGGTGKTIVWNALTDFSGHFETQMKARVKTIDVFGNVSNRPESVAFALDTAKPIISNLTASQTSGSNTVVIAYDLSDGTSSNLNVSLQISSDGGLSWTVPTTSVSGDVGSGRETGIAKSITWNAGTDFPNQNRNNMRVRLIGTDAFSNVGDAMDSLDFTLNTLPSPAPPAPVAVNGGGGIGANVPPVLPSVSIIPVTIIPETALESPIILSPVTQTITTPIPAITGTATPFSNIELTLDNKQVFHTKADANGAWTILIPSVAALDLGAHTFSVRSIGETGTQSAPSSRSVVRIAPSIVVSPKVTVRPPSPTLIPSPSAEEIKQITRAVELPGLAIPRVVTAASANLNGNMFTFTGTALPNARVAIYIHSTQALIYQTVADAKGKWKFTHSQQDTELIEGDHSIYAVALDPNARVKSRPSEIRLFTVKKDLFTQLFGYLNVYTTGIALCVLIVSVLWLRSLKKKGLSQV